MSSKNCNVMHKILFSKWLVSWPTWYIAERSFQQNRTDSFRPATSTWFILETNQRQPTMLQHALIPLHYSKWPCQIYSPYHTNAFHTCMWGQLKFSIYVFVIKGPCGASCFPTLWQIQCRRGSWGCSPPLTESHDVRVPPFMLDIRGLLRASQFLFLSPAFSATQKLNLDLQGWQKNFIFLSYFIHLQNIFVSVAFFFIII